MSLSKIQLIIIPVGKHNSDKIICHLNKSLSLK